jgi:hypothetical protein
MSRYSDISKHIGWEPKKVNIPTTEQAKELREQITINHCESAFKTVFTIYRFAATAKNEKEYEAMRVIYDAYQKGSEIFKDK